MKIYPEWGLRNFIAPAILITIGLSFILRRKTFVADRRSDKKSTYEPAYNLSTTTDAIGSTEAEDVIDIAAVFGAVKKNVYSKNFKGGESVAIFGGSEIDLMNADFTGTVKLEIVNIFGGTTLFIPAHWQIHSEATAIFGAIEDKRQRPAGISSDKILVIEGFVMMGGIDIKSR